jgi:hypothetical protein
MYNARTNTYTYGDKKEKTIKKLFVHLMEPEISTQSKGNAVNKKINRTAKRAKVKGKKQNESM